MRSCCQQSQSQRNLSKLNRLLSIQLAAGPCVARRLSHVRVPERAPRWTAQACSQFLVSGRCLFAPSQFCPPFSPRTRPPNSPSSESNQNQIRHSSLSLSNERPPLSCYPLFPSHECPPPPPAPRLSQSTLPPPTNAPLARYIRPMGAPVAPHACSVTATLPHCATEVHCPPCQCAPGQRPPCPLVHTRGLRKPGSSLAYLPTHVLNDPGSKLLRV